MFPYSLLPSAYSTSRQSAFTSDTSSIDWQRASRRRGEQTGNARHCAREIATLRRLREKEFVSHNGYVFPRGAWVDLPA